MFNELTEYVSVLTRIDESDLDDTYRTLIDVVMDYRVREDASDEVEESFELLLNYFEGMDDLLYRSRDLDVAKELTFLRKNVSMFGHFNSEDRIVMLISLLTISFTRLRDKTRKY